MTTSDVNVSNLIINKLTRAQYNSITPSDTELYFITDDTSSVDIDELSITLNSSDELQTIGVINQNNNTQAIKIWTGTKAEYEQLLPIQAYYAWVYNGVTYYTTSETPEVGDIVYNANKENSGYVVVSASSNSLEIGEA